MRGTVIMRVSGQVQGVGLGPAVWRMAMACGLDGDVRNDGEDILVRLSGALAGIDTFRTMLARKPPPLARIDAIDLQPLGLSLSPGFAIVESKATGNVRVRKAGPRASDYLTR